MTRRWAPPRSAQAWARCAGAVAGVRFVWPLLAALCPVSTRWQLSCPGSNGCVYTPEMWPLRRIRPLGAARYRLRAGASSRHAQATGVRELPSGSLETPEQPWDEEGRAGEYVDTDSEDSDDDDDDDWYESLPARLLLQAKAAEVDVNRDLERCRVKGHTTVFLKSLTDFIFPDNLMTPNGKIDGTYVDCTFGRGGHSREILSRLSEKGRLIAFDIDPSASAVARKLSAQDSRFEFHPVPFGLIATVLDGEKVDGVLADIGVSSIQLDVVGRGFSMSNLSGSSKPLDLRMNPAAGIPASDWLMDASAEELAWLFSQYSNQNVPADSVTHERVAQALVDDQKTNGKYDMRRLAEIIMQAQCQGNMSFQHPERGMTHPAKLHVQAIRTHLNQELVQLEEALPLFFDCLAPRGRCAISTFKISEEERIRKFLRRRMEPPESVLARIKDERRLCELYPFVQSKLDSSARLFINPMKPPQSEVKQNRRARSGKMYIIEKVPRRCKRIKGTPRQMEKRMREPSSLPEIFVESNS